VVGTDAIIGELLLSWVHLWLIAVTYIHVSASMPMDAIVAFCTIVGFVIHFE
jgi:hypothetical protein